MFIVLGIYGLDAEINIHYYYMEQNSNYVALSIYFDVYHRVIIQQFRNCCKSVRGCKNYEIYVDRLIMHTHGRNIYFYQR